MKQTHSHNINTYVVIFILLSFLMPSLVIAKPKAPEIKVETVFSQIESSLLTLKNKDTFTKENIRDVLTEYLLPEVNTQFFSNKVLGKNLIKIPNDLKSEFTIELSKQLINSYSHLLSKYNNEAINIGNSTLSKSSKIAMVKISIVGKNKTNNAIIKLLKSEDDIWKFFDIIVEGISLLDTKQKEINSSLQRLGIEGTLSHLKAVNIKSISSL